MNKYKVNAQYRYPGLSVGDEFEAEPSEHLEDEVSRGYLTTNTERIEEANDGIQAEK